MLYLISINDKCNFRSIDWHCQTAEWFRNACIFYLRSTKQQTHRITAHFYSDRIKHAKYIHNFTSEIHVHEIQNTFTSIYICMHIYRDNTAFRPRYSQSARRQKTSGSVSRRHVARENSWALSPVARLDDVVYILDARTPRAKMHRLSENVQKANTYVNIYYKQSSNQYIIIIMKTYQF